jgi:hypothetical protein
MAEVMDPTPTGAPTEAADLGEAVPRVLAASEEPMTLPRIQSQLPAALRRSNVEEYLRRQVTANVLYQYPRYRSQQDRFWDRPMTVHVTNLLREALREGPLGWSDLRRKLPAYAQPHAEAVLQELLPQGSVHRHPRTGRGGERFGLTAPDPRDYLRPELTDVFRRLAQLGFTHARLREAALELLHEEEWASPPLERGAPKEGQPEPVPPEGLGAQ